ncbi:MAG: hypothetical protein MK108_14105 [Mariniblastus sp.]|nr:hypothetical protein [Mariniblastus sp.]
MKQLIGGLLSLRCDYPARLAVALTALVCWSHSEIGFPSAVRSLTAQQIGISTPFTTARDSYYERMGVDFGFRLPGGRGPGSRIVGLMPNGQFTPNGNLIFRQGGMSSAIPPFGGYDPGANARFGFNYLNRGGGGFSLGFDFGKGSNRSMTTTTPSLVVQNGHGGSITDGVYRPFVTGVIPVIGNGQRPQPYFPDNAVTRAIQSGVDLTAPHPEDTPDEPATTPSLRHPFSSARTGDLSVTEIKAQKLRREAERKAEFNAQLELVQIAESNEDYRVARIHLRKAIRLCEDASQKERLQSHLQEIRSR